ncbi:hypothetical protein [Blastococcus sp. SYSU DS0973]
MGDDEEKAHELHGRQADEQPADEEQLHRRGRHRQPEEEDSLDWLAFSLRRG